MQDDEIVVEPEPGETVIVEPVEDADVHDESVEVHDFSSQSDESQTVIVNVEVPEPSVESTEEAMPEWAQRLESKIDTMLGMQVVDVLQEQEPEPVIVEEEPTGDVVEVEPEPVVEETETVEQERARKRRFGR